MTNPTARPALRPSPMDVGAIVTGTFEVFKRRFGLFVLLTVAPIGLVLALGGGLLAIGSSFRNSLASGWDVRAQLLVGLVLGYIVLAAASVMAQLKFGAMTSAAAAEVVEGRHPTLGDLWERTRGVTARLIVVVLIIVGAVIALIGLFGAFLVVLGRSADSGDDAGAAAAVLLFFVVFPLVMLVAAYFGTRWIYVLPIAAIERASGGRILGRSWELTRGAFWRTFGFNFVAVLIANAVSTAASIPARAASMQLATVLGSSATASTPADVVAMLSSLPLTVGLALLLSFAVQLVTVPFQLIYQTVMYLDQVGRHQLAEQAALSPFPGYPPQGPTLQQPWTPSSWGAPVQPAPSQQAWPPQSAPQAWPPQPAPQAWPPAPAQQPGTEARPWPEIPRQP